MEAYRVNLDVYNGPLDLLLYLIRREEVDIYDIPVARITEQYCSYVDLINEMDPNLAGEFLVMASTLLEIKSRMLLPRAEENEDDSEAESNDPRAELVRQLLQYKAFKDAAYKLDAAGELAALQHPRRPTVPQFQKPELDMEDVHIWDLLEAFNSIMASVGIRKSFHQVIYDDKPVSLYAEDLLDMITQNKSMRFAEVFKGRQSRSEITGLFLAMLELIRQKLIRIQQESNFGEIYISQTPPEQSAGRHFNSELADGQLAPDAYDEATGQTGEGEAAKATEAGETDSYADADAAESASLSVEDADTEDMPEIPAGQYESAATDSAVNSANEQPADQHDSDDDAALSRSTDTAGGGQ